MIKTYHLRLSIIRIINQQISINNLKAGTQAENLIVLISGVQQFQNLDFRNYLNYGSKTNRNKILN
jgi:hypothetical protein